MQGKKTFREESKELWQSTLPIITSDQLKIGCLQRIADATELMVKRYQDLIDDRDMYKRWYENEVKTSDRLEFRVAALKGVITKMKKAKP